MPGRNHLIDGLLALPWWINLGIAALVFAGATYVVPAMYPATANFLKQKGWMVSIPFIVAAMASAIRQWRQGRLLNRQRDLDSIRALTWQDFEVLVAEAFRRQGYFVAQHGGAAPDGGIDLILTRAGSKTIVQCKRWQAWKVSVNIVRELYGVMTAENATSGILVTCGEYTSDARMFATGKPIQLINGQALLHMVRTVQGDASVTFGNGGDARREPVLTKPEARTLPSCPQCGSVMIRRAARKGVSEGREFWGCSTFPKCRGTRPV